MAGPLTHGAPQRAIGHARDCEQVPSGGSMQVIKPALYG